VLIKSTYQLFINAFFTIKPLFLLRVKKHAKVTHWRVFVIGRWTLLVQLSDLWLYKNYFWSPVLQTVVDAILKWTVS